MELYNTLSRQVEALKPQQTKKVSFYSCGPTVYDNPHLGNWSGYIYWDVLARTLSELGYDISWYMNITDVGHLTSDADVGEDKIEKGAQREGKTAWDIADFYTKAFVDGLNLLNISISRDHLPRATEHIAEQIALIKILEDRGYTYRISDGVYYDSTKFDDYARLGQLDIEGLRAGARIDLGEKKNATDFALWKFSPPGAKRDMEWDSPWEKGFPGWHIECSAMSMKYLGQTIDIHAGGIDHIPVHHTNEIAQSQAATGKTFVNHWIHNNHLLIDGNKISKSIGNGILLSDLQPRGFDPQDFRLFILQSHYRTQSNFTWENMDAAARRHKSFKAMADLRFQTGPYENRINLQDYKLRIIEALQNDLNTPQALAILSELKDITSISGIALEIHEEYSQFIEWLDAILGMQLAQSDDIEDESKTLLAQRQQARDNRDWTASDQIRSTLEAKGLSIRDTEKAQVWFRL